MVPSELEPPAVPLTDHATDVLELPVTVAINGYELPARTLAVVGDTEIVVEAGVEGGLLPPLELLELELAPPPQLAKLAATKIRVASASRALELSEGRMGLKAMLERYGC
jgi:hypothetical protein